jgi:hypothetical protein
MVPVVVRDTTDEISIRAIHPHTGEELSLSSGTVVVYNDSGTTVVSSTPATVSGSKATFSQSWPEATYPIAHPPRYYRAEWSLVSGGVTYPMTSHFEVVSRRFRRPIGESDFSSKYPYLSTQIPSGATLSGYLTSAWDRIGSWLYGRLSQYPGNLLYPEQLSEALEYMTISDIHRAIMLGPATEDAEKAKEYKALAEDAMERALSFVRYHLTDDKDSALNEHGVFTGAELVR